MRLINANTLKLEEFLDELRPKYAILSHTWTNDEISFEDIQQSRRPITALGYDKIRFACQQTLKDGLEYVWIDTCCIDKKSSAELQEAINSMYRYYAAAEICYVYLADIGDDCPFLEDESVEGNKSLENWREAFVHSRWFTRGWTLQELLAPYEAKFYGCLWNFVGQKQGLIKTISLATRIDASILTHGSNLSSVSVARRMSWAAHRQTSRVEDKAYCLLGVFNVNMPMLYGEGEKAFIRLQEEILKTSTDHSIFAWECDDSSIADGSLLASSPYNFAHSHRIVQWGKPGAFQMTNRGLQIALPTVECTTDYSEYLAILNCRYANDLSGTLALRLRKYGGSDEYHAMKGRAPLQPSLTPRAKVRPRSRLTFILERVMTSLTPTILQITREFEPEASKIKFWIPQSSSEDVDFEITRAYPQENWDLNDGIMHATDSQAVRGGIMIKTSSGDVYVVAFGFDRVKGDEDMVHLLPGIWGSSQSHSLALKNLVGGSVSRCQHALNSCRKGRCSKMPSYSTVYEFPGREKLEAQIYRATIMTETIFVVLIRIVEVFELETSESIFLLDNGDLGSTESQFSDSVIGQDVKVGALEHDLDIDEEVEKGIAESQTLELRPIEILMRIPEELRLRMCFPSGVKEVVDDIFSWNFLTGQVATGSVLLESVNGSEVVISFFEREPQTLEISAYENSNTLTVAEKQDLLENMHSLPIAHNLVNGLRLSSEDATLSARLRDVIVPGKIAYMIDVQFHFDARFIEAEDADLGAEDPTSFLDVDGETDGPRILSLLPFYSGDHNWNSAGPQDSTFHDTNVLNG